MARYVESGRQGTLALPVAFVAFPLAMGGLAFAYQWLQDFPLWIKAHFLLPLAFGALVGGLSTVAARAGKVRSGGVAVAVALVGVLAADAASFLWAYAADARRRESTAEDPSGGSRPVDPVPARVASPPSLSFGDWVRERIELGWVDTSPGSELARERSEHVERALADLREAQRRTKRWLEESRLPPGEHLPPEEPEVPHPTSKAASPTPGDFSGATVVAVWILEVLLMGFAAVWMARRRRPGPFCESCERWAEPRPLRSVSNADGARMRAAEAAGTSPDLLDPPRVPEGGSLAQRVLWACPTCQDGAWLDVTLQKEAVGSAKLPAHARELVRGLVLTAAERLGVEEREDETVKRRAARAARS